jgi:hypothetical protein
MGSDCRIGKKKELENGRQEKSRSSSSSSSIHQLVLHMLTFVAAADIESASPPMMLFLFCFARVLAKLLLWISH